MLGQARHLPAVCDIVHNPMKKLILKIYFLLRLPLLAAIRILFPAVKQKPQKFSKILLIRLDRLGDFITSLPVIDNLTEAYPEARIYVLVKPYLQELALTIKNIDTVIVYQNFFKTTRRLRRQHFDLAIDLLYDYKLKTAMLAFLSAASTRLGFAWGYRELLFSDFVAPRTFRGKSLVSMNLALIEKIGVPVRVHVPAMHVEKKAFPSRTIIAIHPGGYYPSQRWDRDNFASLAKKLLQRYDCDILVIGTVKEQSLVRQIVSQVNDERARAVFPRMQELAALLSDCACLICNNSGPLHLAAALGVATVSTMGPTIPEMWWPQGNNQIVIRKDLACSPCSKAICQNHDCMNSISIEEMDKAVDSLLEKIKSPA
jgi:ADP-heptose:LPS heptosyltransferase